MTRGQGFQGVLVFVENIPRLSRGGKKFVFVGFMNCQKALRAVGRLNGFRLYVFLLNVTFATRKRKVNPVVEPVQKVWVSQ
ncbi:hypothetical protein V6N13_125197 [Hibiscus sabdariffa]